MSLVAYDSSDEGSENEESEPVEPSAANDTDTDATEAVTVHINSKLSLPAPKVVPHSTSDEEENDDAEGNFQEFLDTLPKPKDPTSVGNVEEAEDDILLKKETESQIPKPPRRQTVKISVPSLSEVCIRIIFRSLILSKVCIIRRCISLRILRRRARSQPGSRYNHHR